MHLEYYDQYKDKIIPGYVVKIENYPGYSMVYTKEGQVYKAINVVIATNFKRRILSPLATFDFTVKNKTIVFNMIGDSINLMIAKLIGGNNKIIILSDGFFALDKMFEFEGETFTLDQLEFHNFATLAPSLHHYSIVGNPVWGKILISKALKKQGLKFAAALEKFYMMLGKIFSRNNFIIKFPNTIRTYDVELSRAKDQVPTSNGYIVIKYWPIDAFESLFGKDIKKNISAGYLLNDLPFFIDQGLVQCYRKSDTIVDKTNKTIMHDGKTIDYDFFVEGDSEFPNLPEIIIKHPNGLDEEYQYSHRNNYFGVIPKNLSNIFHIGVTRPSTGGLGNLTEMQSLLIHKLVSNDKFKNEIYSTLDKRIDEYNKTHYFSSKESPSDHLVYYGLFTHEVATVLGINDKVSDCRSIRDLMKYYFFPNNAFKYRQKGEYKVEGCDKLVDFIYDEHKGFYILPVYFIAFFTYVASFIVFFVRCYLVGYISLPVLIGLLVILYFTKMLLIYATNYAFPIYLNKYTLLRMTYLVVCLIAPMFFNPLIFIPLMLGDFLFSFIMRQINPERSRLLFNDLKIKRRHKEFFAKYLKAFRELRLKE